MEIDHSYIFDKVVALFLKYGIKSVTMDDIARELGISKKTLYQCVNDKDVLVEKIIEYESAKQISIINAIKEKELNAIEEHIEVNRLVDEALREFSPAIEFDLKKYYPMFYKKINTIKLENIKSMVIFNIKKGKQEGLYREDIDEEIIARIVAARVLGSINENLFTLDQYTSIHYRKELLNYHIRGIATPKGVKVLEELLKKI
jgi:AcrR family transcriptional regulator